MKEGGDVRKSTSVERKMYPGVWTMDCVRGGAGAERSFRYRTITAGGFPLQCSGLIKNSYSQKYPYS